MAIDDLVIFNGEIYYVVGEAYAQKMEGEDQGALWSVTAINRVEVTDAKGISRASWVPTRDLILLTSALHYYGSEWYQGVASGNTR